LGTCNGGHRMQRRRQTRHPDSEFLGRLEQWREVAWQRYADRIILGGCWCDRQDVPQHAGQFRL